VHKSPICIQGKETEHNWAARERSVVKIRGMIKGEAHIRFTDAFLAGLKANMLDRTLKTVCKVLGCGVRLRSNIVYTARKSSDNRRLTSLLPLRGPSSFPRTITGSIRRDTPHEPPPHGGLYQKNRCPAISSSGNIHPNKHILSTSHNAHPPSYGTPRENGSSTPIRNRARQDVLGAIRFSEQTYHRIKRRSRHSG
jgi:hypothetical protein